MGKITSMHFAGWKLGLKTGMYYLRTMAASAPIQFTVDQEQLKVADTNIARERYAPKKRTSLGYNGSYAAIPRPMYAQKAPADSSATSLNGMPTPAATPPVASENKPFVPAVTKKVLQLSDGTSSEEGSPKALPTDPVGTPDVDESLPEPASEKKKTQVEDDEKENEDREGDIYAQKVLACEFRHGDSTHLLIADAPAGSIENPESCVMCSG
jgi:ribonucleoside-diphosphate reductase subunit M1